MVDNEKHGNGYGQDPNPEHGKDNQGHNGNNGNHSGHDKKPTHPHGSTCNKY